MNLFAHQYQDGRNGTSIRIFFVLALSLCGLGKSTYAQVSLIDKALGEHKLTLAAKLLKQQVNLYYSEGNPDSLNNLIFYTGKITQQKSSVVQAIQEVQQLIEKIKKLHPTPPTLRQTYLEAGEYYGTAGKNQLAYSSNEKALLLTGRMKDPTPEHFGIVESNLGTYAQRLGDINLSKLHNRRALKYFLSDIHPDPERIYTVYNNMGAIMWYASKTDSALYYFEGALEALTKTNRSAVNRFYRPAVIQNNLSALYGSKGNTTAAIKAMKVCITNLKDFLASPEPSQKKSAAVAFQYEAIDNLAGIYKELGDLRQAGELLNYSYQEKQKFLDKDNPAIFISQILLGQLYYAMKEFGMAKDFLEEGLKNISRADGDYIYWKADACYALALLFDEKKNVEEAKRFFTEADKLYEISSQGEYDDITLEFFRNESLFYAENDMKDNALQIAGKGYRYINETQGDETLPVFYQLLNLAEVHFASGNYKQSLEYSHRGLQTINRIIHSGTTLIDSIKIELKKPQAILLKAKSEYALLAEKNVTSLGRILTDLNEAMQIIEKRKSVIQDPQDISVLMAGQRDLLEFIKKITLDLYRLTGEDKYADLLVSLHESSIYNRLRSRLDKSEDAHFAFLPKNVIEKEIQLKNEIAGALNQEGNNGKKMQAYLKATENWNTYLRMLRTEYPRYYKMRYASIFKTIKDVQAIIPRETTVIRYFYSGETLMALVADNQEKHLIRLETPPGEKLIERLPSDFTDIKATSADLYDLYGKLWAPLSKYIRWKNVVIIPDGVLYNLNFELLTEDKINAFEELGTKSLLSHYTFSYQYSLFLLDQQEKTSGMDENFVAFAPGFSDRIKNEYKAAVKDSIIPDRAYLSLLPQPFTISLADKIKHLLGGSAYMDENSTLTSFRQNAGGHKIIHIGTHAESDNLHPEFSRLIFAKDLSAKEDINSLYLLDIYNCDLRSDLTVLSACETGKPGYQDGEGMLSLAHAFNYAGSKSIITGLWKIDEQGSVLLMELFYRNLLDGMPKNEALRKAKLAYLSKSSGRMLQPGYWAGLVLIGNTAAINIDRPVLPFLKIILLTSLLIIAILIVRRLAA